MKIILSYILFPAILIFSGCEAQPEVEFIERDNQIDVMIGDQLITSYLYGPHLSKPVLFPVYSPSGAVVTRSYPLKEIEGESKDHSHHTGVFFTYGSNGEVNGNSFWWNKHDLPPFTMDEKAPQIKQVEILKMMGGKNKGTLETVNHWNDSINHSILKENRLMEFYASENEYTIDFTIRLSALDKEVTFKDTKEGMFAIRVSDWLTENTKSTLYKSTGEYLNAEGEKTEKMIWGKQSPWVRLEGENEGKTIGVAIFHHPQSLNHPTYWHARGYGCFAANPIGQNDYQKGRGVENPETRELRIQPGKSELFRFRMIIYEGSRTKEYFDQEFERFSKS